MEFIWYYKYIKKKATNKEKKKREKGDINYVIISVRNTKDNAKTRYRI